MDKKILQKIVGVVSCHTRKQNIIVLALFLLTLLTWGSAAGENTSVTDENPGLFDFGSLTITESTNNPLFCTVTIYDKDGILKVYDSNATLNIETIKPDSHIYIESNEKNVSLDFTIDGDSFDPVVRIENYGRSNPAGNNDPPGSPLTYVSVDVNNLSYSNLRLTIDELNLTGTVGAGNLKIFKFVEAPAQQWVELPIVVDDNAVSTDIDSASVIAVTVIDSTDYLQTISIGEISVVDLIGNISPAKTEIVGPEGILANAIGILSIGEVPGGSHLIINSAEKNIMLDFSLSGKSLNPDILFEDFANENPVADCPPPGKPIKYLMVSAERLGYSCVYLTICNPAVDVDNVALLRYNDSANDWEELTAFVDVTNNTISTTLYSDSIIALVYSGTSVNTRQSIYHPEEMAEIVIVVLDSSGAPVSNASIGMNVTSPNGTAEYFLTSAGSITETADPGVYGANYSTTVEGQYNITCTAIIEGNESRFETYFMVQDVYDFDIIRHAQSKIDPTKYDTFDVTIDITSYTDADTITIWEYVPAEFKVYTDADVVGDMDGFNFQILTWNRSLLNNKTSVSYSYSVPMEWPKLYRLGPLEIDYGKETFNETGVWYVAVDPGMLANGDFASDLSGWTIATTDPLSVDWNNTNDPQYGAAYGHIDSEKSFGTGNLTQGVSLSANPGSALLSFKWKKAYDQSPNKHRIYVQLIDPDNNAVWSWSDTTPANTGWISEEPIDVKSYIDTAGIWKVRLSWDMSTSNNNYWVGAWFDDVNLEITEEVTAAPSISNVANSTPTGSRVSITWDTNQSDSNNRVNYSLNSNLSDGSWSRWDNSTDSVSILLTGLVPNTTYYYSAYSYNGLNSSLYSNSSINSFTTPENVTVEGTVTDCTITVYGEDGIELTSTNGNSFNLDDVPIGAYVQFDALTSKNITAKFKINGISSGASIILDDYGASNPESSPPPVTPVKYVGVSATNVSYDSVEIRMHYNEAELGSLSENDLKIYHYKNGAWNKMPTSVDAANNILTAQASSLSTFAAAGATVFDFLIEPTAVNNTESRFGLVITNTDSNDLVDVNINCTLPSQWNIISVVDGNVDGQVISWDGGISLPASTSITRYFNATGTAAGNYNFTCNGSGNATAYQVQNRDFSSGSEIDAEYWEEYPTTGDPVTQWQSTDGNPDENMYMYSGNADDDCYCNQTFAYNGPTPPTYANLSFDWYRDLDPINDPDKANADLYVELQYPNGTVATIWINNTDTDQEWTRVSQDITSHFDATGQYGIILHADLHAKGGGTDYGEVCWDNAYIEITNSYANEENVTVSIPVAASVTGITTNKSSYSSNETVAINTTVTNTGGDNVTGNLNLSIRYMNGTILDDAASYLGMLIPYAESNTTTSTWNTTTTSIGNYLAYAQFNYTNQTSVPVSTTNQTPFSIAGDLNITVDAGGPYNYEVNETVNVSGTVNDSSNLGVPSATVNVTIYDPENVWTNSTEITTDVNGTYNTSLIIPSAVLGTYTTDVRANNSSLEGVGFDTFKIRRLTVTTDTDKVIYSPAEVMWVSGVVSDEETGALTGSASVNVTIYNSTWAFIENDTTTTGTDGSYSLAFISPLDEGTYHVNVSATDTYSITGAVQTAFNVSQITSIALFPVTDRGIYLLDPYQWVTLDAGNVSGCFPDGHSVDVEVDIMVLDQRGHLTSASVSYDVYNSSGLVYSGTATEMRHGFYNDTFQINETTGTGSYTIEVTATYGTVTGTASVPLYVNRWACDGCHGKNAFEGSGQHDTWAEVLGGASGGSVTYSNLVDYEITHTPLNGTDEILADGHESVNAKPNTDCNGCHSGIDSIECTECHTGYSSGAHKNVVYSNAPATSCANSSCHGHMDVGDLPGDLENRYPNCSDCHPLSYLDGTLATTPDWYRNDNATVNPGIHPGGTGMNETVNCSYCHYPFHRTQSQTWTLNNRNCTSCHSNAAVFTNHSYDNVTCAGCHQFSCDSDNWYKWYGSTDELDYHNITIPSCLTCHPGYENHSSYQTDGVSCLQCHDHDPIYSYEGSVMRSGATYATGTSIHSIYNDTSVSRSLIPDCTACHDNGYANHSLYDTYGVYCTYCHDNLTLNYNSNRYLLYNGTAYNTSYNVGTEIHTLNRTDMIPNCTDCHGSDEYNTHLGDATEVVYGTAANCTQCHDNVTLTYNASGTVLTAGASYNTNGEIHATARASMLPNQTADLNDSCAICHVTVYNETTRMHSNYTACYKCHFDPNVQYQNETQDRPVEHSMNETMGCRACHFNYTRVVDEIGKSRYWINETMFGESVHGNQSVIDCTDCHTQYHRPPEYTWKWCECCHSYQSDPVNDTDRHNVTLKPQNYLVGGTSVLDITDCTTCHNGTRYNTSKSTFNRAAGKDCRYCHTYPDQTYY